MSRILDNRMADELARWVSSWTGYSPEAIRREPLERVVRTLLKGGSTLDQLCERAARGDANLVQAMLAAVAVGETSFFRQPQHFEWIAREKHRWPIGRIRAWSAGCATGEEAYSLAACLISCFGANRVEILGTDLLQQHVETARRGVFGRWSLRTSSPLPFPLFGPVHRHQGDDRYSIDERVRSHVRFEQHNLLEDPPISSEGFDIIICRNVLLYFSPDSARVATTHLASALADGGVVMFGALDISHPPVGLRRLGPPDLNICERIPLDEHPTARPSLRPRVAVQSWRPDSWDTAIAQHLRALTFIERGQRAKAEDILRGLRITSPDYLPGLFEQALLYVRAGDRASAITAMKAIQKRCSEVAAETIVPGPENLSIEYYRVAAHTYLGAFSSRRKDDDTARP